MYDNIINHHSIEFKYKLFVWNKPPLFNLQLFPKLVMTMATLLYEKLTSLASWCSESLFQCSTPHLPKGGRSSCRILLVSAQQTWNFSWSWPRLSNTNKRSSCECSKPCCKHDCFQFLPWWKTYKCSKWSHKKDQTLISTVAYKRSNCGQKMVRSMGFGCYMFIGCSDWMFIGYSDLCFNVYFLYFRP